MYLAPLAMADSVLTDSEKRAGCMLVDLGADTTTVSVYYKGILRHLSVIPLGGGNVTKDLTCLQIEEPDAEKMKLKYAKAYTDINNIDPTLNYPIDKDRVVESKKFIEIVEARVEEIVENAWFQIPVEFSDKLLGVSSLQVAAATCLKSIRFSRHIPTSTKYALPSLFLKQSTPRILRLPITMVQ